MQERIYGFSNSPFGATIFISFISPQSCLFCFSKNTFKMLGLLTDPSGLDFCCNCQLKMDGNQEAYDKCACF